MGLTFGSTRCGKGVNAIIPALMTYGAGSCVVIDPKGENAWITAERRRQMGQRVVILDPWDEVNRRWGRKFGVTEKTTKFNPLSALNADDPDFADDCTAIADSLVIDQSSDPHWSNSARELIAGLVAYIAQVRPGEGSLRSVRKLAAASGQDLTNAIRAICEDAPESLAARKLAGFVDEDSSAREFGSVRSTARQQTSILDSARLIDAMETDENPFNLADVGTQNVTVYLVLPVDKLETHGRWLRLLVTLLIRTIARQASPPAQPVLFILDEFGTIGKLQAVETAYGLLAGLNVRIWAFLQGLDQLKHFYPNSWQTFIGNSSVIQVLNARNDETAEWVSKYMGVTTVEERTGITWKPVPWQEGEREQVLQNWRPLEFPNDFNVKRAARQEMQASGFWTHNNKWVDDTHWISRPLMYPDEVVRLPDTESLVLLPGSDPHRIGRLSYFQEPRWAGWYRDPYTYQEGATA